MTKSSILFLISAAVLVLVISVFSLSPASPDGPARRKAVVVELFTSESCSSCPPADDLLGRLRGAPAAGGAEVIPLEFHVDYWNHLGWQDRFSSSAFTSRQEMYATRFRLDGPYTPQMVVDGGQEFIGSSSREAREAIARAVVRPEEAEVQLSFSAAGKLSVRVKGLIPGAAGEVMLAVTEDNLSTSVGGGENSGHVLHHAAVVRELRTLGQLGQLKDGRFETEAAIQPVRDWKLNDLRVVVFVQPASRNARPRSPGPQCPEAAED
ncbi:MAG: DUF1223 domain-containing protein [Acidobacteriia bacterium]|nr:DUF1223 domain-containing protein [Terriglobia bacterium]